MYIQVSSMLQPASSKLPQRWQIHRQLHRSCCGSKIFFHHNNIYTKTLAFQGYEQNKGTNNHMERWQSMDSNRKTAIVEKKNGTGDSL
jgi:hypothetical protein